MDYGLDYRLLLFVSIGLQLMDINRIFLIVLSIIVIVAYTTLNSMFLINPQNLL